MGCGASIREFFAEPGPGERYNEEGELVLVKVWTVRVVLLCGGTSGALCSCSLLVCDAFSADSADSADFDFCVSLYGSEYCSDFDSDPDFSFSFCATKDASEGTVAATDAEPDGAQQLVRLRQLLRLRQATLDFQIQHPGDLIDERALRAEIADLSTTVARLELRLAGGEVSKFTNDGPTPSAIYVSEAITLEPEEAPPPDVSGTTGSPRIKLRGPGHVVGHVSVAASFTYAAEELGKGCYFLVFCATIREIRDFTRERYTALIEKVSASIASQRLAANSAAAARLKAQQIEVKLPAAAWARGEWPIDLAPSPDYASVLASGGHGLCESVPDGAALASVGGKELLSRFCAHY
eukprot:SAG31_NODE_7933_length_1561_cov_1.528044_1_plen_352_part_00